jgi:hypothetical protein
MGGGGMGSMGGGAGAKVVLRAEGFGLEGCDLLLLKHLTDKLMHLDRHLLSGLKVKELEEDKFNHSEDFDLLRLIHLSSVYNVVTSPDSMKIEDGKSPHVNRPLPSRTLDMPRSKGDCDGCFSVPLLVVVVVARVLHFVVNLLCNKMDREVEKKKKKTKAKKKNGW